MTSDPVRLDDPRVQRALDELAATIRARYPTATFTQRRGEDPRGVYLIATVDTEDITDVIDLVTPHLLELQIDERLPVYVVPVHTPERTAARLRTQRRASAPPTPATAVLRS